MSMECDSKYKLMESYCRKHNSLDVDHNSTNKNKILREQCLNYLLSSDDQFPLRHSEDYQKVLGRCCALDNWQPRKTEKALKVLEQYALNVYKYPWKREFNSIKTYSGFFCTRIKPYIPDVEHLLSQIGFNASPENEAILMLSSQAIEKHEQVLSTAFTFWLLQNECEILLTIYSNVLDKIPSTQKIDGLYHDVHRCRASITLSSGINDCVEAVLRKRAVISRSNGVVTSAPSVQLPPFRTPSDAAALANLFIEAPSRFRDTSSSARSKRSLSPREQQRLTTAASVVLTSTPRPYSSIRPVLRKVSYRVNDTSLLNKTLRPKVVFNDDPATTDYCFSKQDVIAQSSPEKLFENRSSTTDYAKEVALKARQSSRFSIYDNEPVTML